MKTKHLIIGLFAAVLTFTSCSEDEGVNFEPIIPGAYQNGLLIANEGPFSSGSGTVTYISNNFSTVEQSIYNTVNNEDLGSIVQSIAFDSGKAYIIANNSNKITVADRGTFVKETTIETGIMNPRYMAFSNGVGYVTNWGDASDVNDDFIAIIDLTTNTVTSTISVVEGPEQIVVANGKLFVSHKGGWGQGNSLSVIAADNSVTTIAVGDVPVEMSLDLNNNIWLLCEGRPSYAAPETGGKLMLIDTSNEVVSQTFDFGATEHPNELTVSGGVVYYALSGNVYAMNELDINLPTTSIITTPTYDMRVNNGFLYATDAGTFSSDGTLKVFDLSDNSETQSIVTGIIPGGIYFN